MELPPNEPIFEEIAEKLRNKQKLTLKEIKKFRKATYRTVRQFSNLSNSLIKKLGDREEEIHACQLQYILDFIIDSQAGQYENINLPNLSKKILKFLKPEFDHDPHIQDQALQIFCLVNSFNSPLTEEQVHLVTRMVTRCEEGILAYSQIIDRFYLSDQQTLTIIDMIERFDSLGVLRNLFDRDPFHEYTGDICEIFDTQLLSFKEYNKKLIIKNQKMDNLLFEKINLAFANFHSFFTTEISKEQLSLYQIRYFLNCLTCMNQNLPIFKFSIQDFYLNRDQIEVNYFELKDEISRNTYETGIVKKFNQIYKNGWQWNYIIRSADLLIRFMTIEQFVQEVIPTIRKLLQQKNYYVQMQSIATVLIKFINVYKEDEEGTQILLTVLCDSGFFNSWIEYLTKEFQKMCSIFHFPTQNIRKIWNNNLKLFYFCLVAFEIISSCNIVKMLFLSTLELLKNSVKLVKEYVEHQWPNKILDNFMTTLMDEQKQQKDEEESVNNLNDNHDVEI